MDINTVMQYVTFGMALLGVLAFMVSNCGTGNQGNAISGEDSNKCSGTDYIYGPVPSGSGCTVYIF